MHHRWQLNPQQQRRFRRLGTRIVLSFLLIGTLLIQPVLATSGGRAHTAQTVSPSHWMQEAKAAYAKGQWSDAAQLWQDAATAFQAQGEWLNHALALNNLALVSQDLQQWSTAERAIAQAIDSTQTHTLDHPQHHHVLAQLYSTQGLLAFNHGQTRAALAAWNLAAEHYQQANDPAGELRVQINQAQALQALGQQRRALSQLTQIVETLEDQKDTVSYVAALLARGYGLRSTGELQQAESTLERALTMANQLGLGQAASQALLELDNLAQIQNRPAEALERYHRVIEQTNDAGLKLEAEVNQLSVWVNTQNTDRVVQAIPVLGRKVQNLPWSNRHLQITLHFLESLLQCQQKDPALQLSGMVDVPLLLQTVIQAAQTNEDLRSHAYGLGLLGYYYEQVADPAAEGVTQQALQMAEISQADDLIYRWKWQLGRIYRRQGRIPQAITAYQESVTTLQSLRQDLRFSRNLQFSFRESIEPVYRQLVDVLLTPRDEEAIPQNRLLEALRVIESLQVAELDNFFQEACLDLESKPIDQIDPQAAVIYPILLPDRLEIILSIPEEPLQHFTTYVSEAELTETLKLLRRSISNPLVSASPLSRKVYHWFIQPLEPALQEAKPRTLVFIPDGAFRNVPMAALSDGQHYLLEQYNLSVTSGLQLINPEPLQLRRLKVLLAGISEARDDFVALPGVQQELQNVNAEVAGLTLLNQDFTRSNLEKRLADRHYSIVHLATHGQFSSDASQNFLLTWEGRISIDQLQELLQIRQLRGQTSELELLVLSACQSALGDDRAALGLAGMALRSGARSTLATLWSVNDQATAMMMTAFYQALIQPGTTKAEALRIAQRSLLDNPRYKAPYFWAPYILIGNWL